MKKTIKELFNIQANLLEERNVLITYFSFVSGETLNYRFYARNLLTNKYYDKLTGGKYEVYTNFLEGLENIINYINNEKDN